MDPILSDLPSSLDKDALVKNIQDVNNLIEELKAIDDDEILTQIYSGLVLIANRNTKDAQTGIALLCELNDNYKLLSNKY